jgi:hypothetical protein
MLHLYQQLASKVDVWREKNYTFTDCPAISEILESGYLQS